MSREYTIDFEGLIQLGRGLRLPVGEPNPIILAAAIAERLEALVDAVDRLGRYTGRVEAQGGEEAGFKGWKEGGK